MTLSILDTNLLLIKNKWPIFYASLIQAEHDSLEVSIEEKTIVINNIQLTSNYDRVAEASLQISRIDECSNKAFIYGSGFGDSAKLLLQRKSIKDLHVVILNLGVFLHILNTQNHSHWLMDKRITLHCAQTMSDIYKPFCANPSELVLCDDKNVQLRDRITTELNNDFVQKQFDTDNLYYLKNRDYVLTDPDISSLSSPINENIFIAAAGPTLESHLHWLSKNKPFIIALDAAVQTLLSVNIIPNIVVSIDKRVFQLFEAIPPATFSNSKLVYFPNVDSRLLAYWEGERYCSYSETAMYKNFCELKRLKPLFSSGSVIHPAIDLAVNLGANNIILFGADFSFTHNKAHATPDGSKKSELNVTAANHWLFNYLGDKVPTMANFKGYLRDLEKYIESHPNIKFYSGSPLGAKIEGAELWEI